jgi:hypothetical protein
MKYNWSQLLEKMGNTSKLKEFTEELTFGVSVDLKPEIYDFLTKEIQAKARWILDEDQKDIWVVYKYLQVLLVNDTEDFAKEINLKRSIAQLVVKRYNEEQGVINNTKYSTDQKDIILEDIERKYKNEEQALRATFPKRYELWAIENIAALREYSLIRSEIDSWFKASFSSQSVSST